MSETPYVTVGAVADYFQVSVSTIRKWVHDGNIPTTAYIKIGDVYRFRLKDVEAALTDAADTSETTNP